MAILETLSVEGPKYVRVPESEVAVLRVLADLGEAHGPKIARASQGAISVAAVYQLLSRLEKRGLVEKREEHVLVGDITARRVLYRVCEAVVEAPAMRLTRNDKPTVEAKSTRRKRDSSLQEASLNPAVV